MRIAYVLEDAGLSGGARVVLEHCNRLAARGHDVTLFTATWTDPRRWFPLKVRHVPVGGYPAIEKRLRAFDGCKVATWWKTAPVVARSGGRGFYLVQDIETSYLQDERKHEQVLATYRLPLTLITESRWVTERLPGARYVGIGIDHDLYRTTGARRKGKTVLYAYRGHFLKGPDLFVNAAQRLPEEYHVITFGHDTPPIKRAFHRGFVTDAEVADFYNRVAVYVLTSTHEGFALPIVEAMACGCPVITTNADANMEFCIDRFNCLVVNRSSTELASAIKEVCTDRRLAASLAREGLATAARYQWDQVISNLEQVFRA